MDPYISLVAFIHHFEALLQARLGATGTGLSDMALSVSVALPSRMVRAIRYVAMAHTVIEHGNSQNTYQHYPYLLDQCGLLRNYLESLPEVIPDSTWTYMACDLTP